MTTTIATKFYMSPVLRMDRKIKRRWLKALRSGQYKQTKAALHDRLGRMCCLGVICDVMGAPKGQHEGFLLPADDGDGKYLKNTYPTEAISREAGFRQYDYNFAGVLDKRQGASVTYNPVVLHIKTSNSFNAVPLSLAELNDAGFTFNQIADVIDYFL